MTISHPTTEQLRAFGLGELGPDESTRVERHVETCADCCRVLSGIPDDDVLKLLKQGDAWRVSDTGEFTADDKQSACGQVPLALRQHSRYRIIQVLGDGGMGVVYKAEHRLMSRLVALKVINRRLLSNPLAVERFRREFKAAARLTHPNIVVAHDAEEAGGLHFLVMEYVDGVSLTQYVERKGPLPVATACFFIRQAALGLQHAAKQGMVHRDIKPHNLMLTRKGQIKILDFGLARFASEEASLSGLQSTLSDEAEALALTQAGMIVGTPDYMAPEQAVDSSQADIRSDIYSLGCTFYFLLTGQPPFAGNSVASTLDSHAIHHPPNLKALRDDLPTELIRIIEKMMAKNPTRRIQSPEEVANSLKKFAMGGLAAASSLETAARSITPSPTLAALEEPHERVGRTIPLQLIRSRPYQIAASLVLLIVIVIGSLRVTNFGRLRDGGPEAVQAEVAKRPDPTVANNTPVKQHQARVGLVLTRRNFWSPDYLFLRDALERRGAAVTVVSSRVGPVTSEAKIQAEEEVLEVQAEVALEDIRPEDFDALVFIPSSNSEFIHDSEAAPLQALAAQQTCSRVLHEMSDANVCLAALGNGVNLLARCGLLDGHQATGPDWVAETAAYDAVKWDTSQSVVASGPEDQFVTAWNIRSIEQFAKQVYASAEIRSKRAR